MRLLLLLPPLLLSPTAVAQGSAPIVEVQLSSFDFTPKSIHLMAGQSIVLHLVNTGKGGHNFSAPQFFAAATFVSGPVRNGTIEVGSRGTADVQVTPARGTYRLRCTHAFHSALGMKGTIVVD